MRLPIALELDGLSILFVGGGKAVLQKLRVLVPCISKDGPRLTIVAPLVSPEIKSLVPSAICLERPFVESDLGGADLVYCFTDSEVLNGHIAELCRQRKILANVSHSRGYYSFTSPTIRRVGPNIISVSRTDNDAKQSVLLADALSEFARGNS